MTDKQPVGKKSEGPQGPFSYTPLKRKYVIIYDKDQNAVSPEAVCTLLNAKPEPVEGLQELKGLLKSWREFALIATNGESQKDRVFRIYDKYSKALTDLGVDLD